MHDRGRRRQREGPTVSLEAVDGESGLAPVSGEPTAAVRAQQHEETVRLHEALEQLSAVDREIILLRYYGGLSFKEIAAQFEMPLGTVLAKVHRGLKRLRDMLGEDDE